MNFIETGLRGAYRIELERLQDERGFFARSWCQHEFTEHGLDPCVVQCNISFNQHKGTLRGMHYQVAPHAEAKLVRCTRGALYDVIADLRPGSPTYLGWIAVELTAENHTALYVPKGFAHGFQTLEENTEVFYQMSEFYAPLAARGFRWNDPLLNIQWPLAIDAISPKDMAYEDLDPDQFAGVLI
jgi:dTDP-4-dehydrorhamnose 3,5-epimerase